MIEFWCNNNKTKPKILWQAKELENFYDRAQIYAKWGSIFKGYLLALT